ncbi:MAG: hypothetical protein CMF43_05530 [Legionellales bacterium]|nr:hypothetical protein [Legionellales bacterium]|tara:strand:+ start:734 stop:1207 length:474 start_codon:yes stop_codon:yes gene_type:complete
MLYLDVRSIGKPSEHWQSEALAMYQQRIESLAKLSTTTYDCPKRSRQQGLQSLIDKERDLLFRDLPIGCYRITLDERGKHFDTHELMNHLCDKQRNYRRLVFLLGGPDGHHPSARSEAHLVLSLSRFTLPHMFAKIILYEQLYRCLTLMTNHPYHRT